MNVRYDLKNVPEKIRKSIARFARKLLKKQPNIHTIVVDRKQGVQKAEKFTDFELLLLYNAESERETKRIISESVGCGGSEKISENGRIYSPGRAYRKSEETAHHDETSALEYYFPDIHKRKYSIYMEFLKKHLNYFTINDYFDIITINSPEMEKDDPLLYKLFTTYHFEKGYVVFSSQSKPFITTQIELTEE